LDVEMRLVELSAKGHPSCWSTKPCLQLSSHTAPRW
jgi:hypothetical protein